jgi:UDP-N-acetyl-D-mannosaminuronic acid dehydrogenase
MINVIGLGYIGLPTALMLASSGQKVVGTDINEETVSLLRHGQLPFSEAGIDDVFQQALTQGIEFSSDYQPAEIYIVAVPTPFIKSSKKLDPTYVVQAVDRVLDRVLPGSIIVIESTIAPGTIDRYIRPLVESRNLVTGLDVHLVHAPERIIPGNMIHELRHNARTIGCDHPAVGELVKVVYSQFCKGTIVITSIKTAEMTKVVENTYRDINIAFANELAMICHSDNMDVHEIIRIANMHPRVNILQPGPGVGGHCISVDPWFLVGDYPGLANLILTARKINDGMPEFVLNRLQAILDETRLLDPTLIGVYGLSYKENVDDTRESPTLQLFDALKHHLRDPLISFDPMIRPGTYKNQKADFEDFLNSVDVVIVMVAHQHLRDHLDLLKTKKVLDTRYVCHWEGVVHL